MPGRDRHTDTALRVVHDLTQSIWLGGATMGVVAIDAAASTAPDQKGQVAGVDRAWRRWHRISTPAIAAHLVAGVGLTLANRGRLAAQAGGLRTVALRSALTVVALGTEAGTRRLGRRLGDRDPRIRSSTDPADLVDETTVALQRQLRRLQWMHVAALSATVAVGARMGEQQRPRELLHGLASRLRLAS